MQALASPKIQCDHHLGGEWGWNQSLVQTGRPDRAPGSFQLVASVLGLEPASLCMCSSRAESQLPTELW